MADKYLAVVAAGSLRSTDDAAVGFPHRWTNGGVSVEVDFTGAHLLHLAAAGCVLNDVYREAAALGLVIDGVRIAATGDFDGEWSSTGIRYAIEIDSAESAADLTRLVELVDEVAEIPRALRAGASVRRGLWPQPPEAAHGAQPPEAAHQTRPPEAAHRAQPPEAAHGAQTPEAAHRPQPPEAAHQTQPL
jgi:uncharacterized OsmC-like protein